LPRGPAFAEPSKTFYAHVSALTWFAAGALKTVENATAIKICEEILTHGFLTAGEPLKLCQDADHLSHDGVLIDEENYFLPAFSAGFTKGQARSHTLLTMLSLVFDNGLDLKEVAL
jgi:hypothetical protein